MSDYFLLIVGWVHAIAAVAWVGGAIFYWVVLRPAVRSGTMPDSIVKFAGSEFSQLVALAMWTLVITGAILMFNRLSGPNATLPYGATLGLKIVLSAWMFFLVAGRRSRSKDGPAKGRLRAAVNALGHINMTIVLGGIVFLLSDILRMLVERHLAS
jgi:putative copper export protein